MRVPALAYTLKEDPPGVVVLRAATDAMLSRAARTPASTCTLEDPSGAVALRAATDAILFPTALHDRFPNTLTTANSLL